MLARGIRSDVLVGNGLRLLDLPCGVLRRRLRQRVARRGRWDAASGRCLLTLNARKALLSAAWSPDGRRLASGSHGHFVTVWDASSGAEVAVLEGHGDEVRGVSWSSDGAWLSSASVDRTVKVWRVDGWAAELTLEGHGAEVNVANWSPDDTRLATASHDCTARVWDVTGAAPPHRCVAVLTHPGVVLDAVWAPSSAGGGTQPQRRRRGRRQGNEQTVGEVQTHTRAT